MLLTDAWHWLILAMILTGLELIAPGFVVIWFGLSAFIVAGVAALMPELSLSLLLFLWATVALGLIGAWFFAIAPRLQRDRNQTLSEAEAIGQVGLMIELPTPHRPGTVRFSTPLAGRDEWPAQASHDSELSLGDRVVVDGLKQQVLQVNPLPEA